MRWLCGLLLLVGVAGAQESGPFRAVDEKFRFGVAVPGVEARFGEELARLHATLDERPADVAALERAFRLLERLRREKELLPSLSAAIKLQDHPRLRALRGRLYLRGANALGDIVLPPGAAAQDLQKIIERLRKENAVSGASFGRAQADLELALKGLPEDFECREDLARVLEMKDRKAHADAIKRLRQEAAVLRMKAFGGPDAIDLLERAQALRSQAEALERVPNHPEALALRRRALILHFCTNTIPFEVKAELWGRVALLAPEHIVQENLTRTYRTRAGEVASVAVQYYRPPLDRQLLEIEALGKNPSDSAAAVLLAIVCQARSETQVAMAAVRAARQEGVRKHLPRLLATALFCAESTYPQYARRLLVQLAGELRVAEATETLRAALAQDRELDIPWDVAAALGRIGGSDDLLIAFAKDQDRALHFRREAAYAVAAEKVAALEGIPELEISVAAVRYRATSGESDLGRLLNGLSRPHEAAVAARYCADLRVREAVGALEIFLEKNPDHYARLDVRAQYVRLLAALRSG